MSGEPYDPPEDDGGAEPERGDYTLGEPAADAYAALQTNREVMCEMGRRMAELTIPSVMPQLGYIVGTDLPGNNQSIGAQCVNNLASKLMFLAFPPGQPIMKLTPVVEKLRDQIAQDPELYGEILLSLSELADRHKERFESTAMRSSYVELKKLLLVAGNALWRHIELDHPTVHPPNTYVVSRDAGGYPLVTILVETVRVATMAEDHRAQVHRDMPELTKQADWVQECKVYSIMKACGEGTDRHWCYWQETEKGTLLDGTDVETDEDDAPMWPCQMIPVTGQNWARSYCEEYRGDLYTVEVTASSMNDGAAAAAWTLFFVKPGSRTSLRQVQKAANLSMLAGSAEDVTATRIEKGGDYGFVQKHFQSAMQRLGTAFLLQSAARRDGERVTAEEVTRVGQELDQAMGGLYTSSSQGVQRRIILRAMHLHEEENKELPTLPKGVVNTNVVTGTDAMGKTSEAQNLAGFLTALGQAVGPEQASAMLNPTGIASRLAAAMNVRPQGIVKGKDEMAADQQQAQQQALGVELAKQAAGPLAGAAAKHIASQQGGGQPAGEQ